MIHGSLFSGIGGFDLAAEWMGWENVFHCEQNKFCQYQLKKNFPNSILHENIITTDFTIYRGRIDIITGGDPCQPWSKAGKQLGKSDVRYLWPEMLRAVREIKPSWIVNENVRQSVNNGLLDQKISDLGNEGYACWPPLLIPSGAKALHERYRAWLVAYSNENAISNHTREIQSKTKESFNKKQRENGQRVRPFVGSVLNEHNWKEIASSLCGNINGIPKRLDRNGAIGNAIDPQVAYEIFKAIEQFEKENYEMSI